MTLVIHKPGKGADIFSYKRLEEKSLERL